jgi:hypothetical protein
MPRIAKVLAIGLVAGAMASGSAAWADGSVRSAMHHKVAVRERAAHMRCRDMRQSVAMHGLIVMQHRTATDMRGRAEQRVVHARRRAKYRCSILQLRAAQHPRVGALTPTIAVGSTGATLGASTPTLGTGSTPTLGTRSTTMASGTPTLLTRQVRLRLASPTTN